MSERYLVSVTTDNEDNTYVLRVPEGVDPGVYADQLAAELGIQVASGSLLTISLATLRRRVKNGEFK
jgi:hypothetical protein